jgi:hypothetical protein
MSTLVTAEKGEKPVLRTVVNRENKWFETAVFWRTSNPGSKAVMTGHIDLGLGHGRIPVFAFVNERTDGGTGKFITLSAHGTDQVTGEIGYKQVAIGNVVNSRADGKEVFFDTVLFNPLDDSGKNIPGAQPVSVYVTGACTDDLHSKLGFTEPRVARPKKQAEIATSGVSDDGGTEQESGHADMMEAAGGAPANRVRP